MKKIVRIFGLCALMAFAFTACNKNNDGKVAINASMPETSSDGRTYLDGNLVKWSGEDQITVFDTTLDVSENYIQLEVASRLPGNSVAKFYGSADFFDKLDTDSVYTAFYPVDAITGISDDSVCVVIPEEQTYAENSFAINTYPMYAFNDGSNFPFRSPAGLLTIGVKIKDGNSSSFTIKEIELEVNGDYNPLIGSLKYSQKLTDGSDAGNDPDYKNVSPKRKIQLVNCHRLISPTNGTTYFNFVVLEGGLEGIFRITLKDESDGTIGTLFGQIPGTGCVEAQMRATMPDIELPIPSPFLP